MVYNNISTLIVTSLLRIPPIHQDQEVGKLGLDKSVDIILIKNSIELLFSEKGMTYAFVLQYCTSTGTATSAFACYRVISL